MVKLAIIFDSMDYKLRECSYSHTYKNQFYALINKWGRDNVLQITKPVDMDKIVADVIIFYDIHSCHHIKLPNIEKHKAIKYEYFNDPYTPMVKHERPDKTIACKLGSKERTVRALERGVNYIICPQKNTYNKYIAPHTPKDMLVWFPTAPKDFKQGEKKLKDRSLVVIINGHLWKGNEEFRPYILRRWAAYQQEHITLIQHGMDSDANTPLGSKYQEYLSGLAGVLAVCDTHIVPKYFEIPLAGCMCFAQYHPEYAELGFRSYENCIFVDESNLIEEVKCFKANLDDYQDIADAGRKLVSENYTARHFADFIYKHAEEHI